MIKLRHRDVKQSPQARGRIRLGVRQFGIHTVLPSLDRGSYVLSCFSHVWYPVWQYGLQPIRLLCPWDFPGKNTGVGYHFLLQGIFPTQGSNPGLLGLPALAGGFFTTGATWKTLLDTVCLKVKSPSFCPSDDFLSGLMSHWAELKVTSVSPLVLLYSFVDKLAFSARVLCDRVASGKTISGVLQWFSFLKDSLSLSKRNMLQLIKINGKKK